jgi:hypothetical protein
MAQRHDAQEREASEGEHWGKGITDIRNCPAAYELPLGAAGNVKFSGLVGRRLVLVALTTTP